MLTLRNSLPGALTVLAVVATVSFRLGATASAAAASKRRARGESSPAERAGRRQRLALRKFDAAQLADFITRHRTITREQLIETGHLSSSAPAKGSPQVLAARLRSEAGNTLLRDAKDILFALLFEENVFERVERELLTLTVPRAKLHALEFMKASTELAGAGTWQDPENVASDERADNVIIEVEYGEAADESIGHGIAAALRVINLLEVNEQILYARMTNIEQSTLVE